MKTPITLSLSSNTPSASSTPKAISAAFGESDVIRKRRENVLQWRLEREATKKAAEQAKSTDTVGAVISDNTTADIPTKPWSWDDDDDEDVGVSSTVEKDVNGDVVMAYKDDQDEEQGNANDSVMDESDVDPLDAFMVDVTAEVKKLEQKEQKRESKQAQVVLAASTRTGDDGTRQGSADDKVEEEEEDLVESSEEEDILAMAAKRIKRKDIPAVDHAKMNYESFRKNFYLEPPEMAEMTPEEVHGLRLELDGIKIRGADCPKPIRKWTQAGLPAGW
jgi:ATP-dependent RNA helicase DDX46/PRP5